MATSPAAPTPVRPRLARKWLLAAAATAVLVLGAGLAYVARGSQAQPAAPAEPAKPVFVTLEPLTVNLQAEGRPRFLHLGLSLKVADDRAQARVAEAMPELRSRLLLLLSNRDPATLSTAADKTALANEIRNELNRPVAAGSAPQGISGIAFNAFVVQ